MKQLVIVEGPTAVGKTTLIARIMEAEPALRQGPHRPAPNAALAWHPRDLMSWYVEALDTPMPCILDRWVYSNHVYSALFQNQVRVPSACLEETMRHQKLKVVVLFLTASPGLLYSRIQKRDKPCVPKDAGTIKNLIATVDRFEQEFKTCGLPKVGIRCDDEGLDSGASLRKALKAIRS